MILRALKSNNLSNLFFIPIAVLAFWAGKLLTPANYPFAEGEAQNVLYRMLYHWFGSIALLNVILSALMVTVLALLIEIIIARYQFIRIRTRLPAILFVLLVGGITDLHTLHPVYFGVVFLLLAIYQFFGIFDQSKAYALLFNVGFFLGLGSLFYFNLFIVVPAFLIGIPVLRKGTGWREYLVLILGFALPFVFTFSYYFYTDRLNELLTILEQNIAIPIGHLKNNIAIQIYLGALVFITLIASIDIARHYDTKKVSSRKFFTVFFFIFLTAMISYVFIPATSQEMLIVAGVPVTFLLSNFLVFLKSRFWGELFFTLLLLLVVALQFLR